MADLHEQLLAVLAPSEPFSELVYDALRAVVERCAEETRDASDPITVESCDELEAIFAGELLRLIARELGIEAGSDRG